MCTCQYLPHITGHRVVRSSETYYANRTFRPSHGLTNGPNDSTSSFISRHGMVCLVSCLTALMYAGSWLWNRMLSHNFSHALEAVEWKVYNAIGLNLNKCKCVFTIYIYMYIYIYVCVFIYIYVCVYVCVYVYIIIVYVHVYAFVGSQPPAKP